MTWRAVTSKKPGRKGEAFLMNGDKFVLKVYKDSGLHALEFATYLARQMNRLEEKRAVQGKAPRFCAHEWDIDGDLEGKYDGVLYWYCTKCGQRRP